MANETGKRYSCAKCNSEFVVTRGGDGAIQCCGMPMTRK
ncbi:MAG: desulfoferrodoxin [Chloroflexi bacterium]|nr:desulfoferrodoxin [Chloroflexota bacterium]MCI0771326.1 desulfoferrodoxin [Chloroflexota bacterium]MCI0796910.1 desulfoferrodoxin [Chloroflexota bacterium]MCI0812901.1 desulfoferrodoxin [Chloroflexota bacterium]MCI0841034.1 desulfoferrodoxin [Chloroflexota bacterium]